MRIKNGTSRKVIVFKNLAIKLPRIYLKEAIKESVRYIRRGEWVEKWKDSLYESHSLKSNLLAGLVANWLEFVYYLKNIRSPILMPTYFSLFGFVNIQKAGPLPALYFPEFGRQIVDITNKVCNEDAHVFQARSNFCVINRKIRIVDYGNPKTQAILDKFGNDIYNKYKI